MNMWQSQQTIGIFYPRDYPVTAKNRLTFNRPTHLVTIPSTIREPWKKRMNMWQSQQTIGIFYPRDYPVTAKNRLTFNRPTHLVTIRSTIREP